VVEAKQERGELRIVGISGSLRPGSLTRAAVEIALGAAREKGAVTEMFDLQQVRVACDGSTEDGGYPESVYRLRRTVKQAHGLILGTPEYHGSFSGVLKNALDLMGFEEFAGKMVGLISVAGGAMGGVAALSSLRSICRVLHAWVIPQQASVPFSFRAFNADGTIKDEKMHERVAEVGRQLVRFTYLHHSKEARSFLEAWEDAIPNPGGNKPL